MLLVNFHAKLQLLLIKQSIFLYVVQHIFAIGRILIKCFDNIYNPNLFLMQNYDLRGYI
jgi:hypothetical protein